MAGAGLVRATGWRTRLIVSLGALALIAGPAAQAGAANGKPFKVMTRNVYLGADLTPALGAPDAASLAVAASGVYDQMIDTNFTARAKRLAKEIDRKKPHLIGLQEVAKWKRDRLGAPDGPATPARELITDFLRRLRGELLRRDLNYGVAVKQRETDVEVPTSRGWDLRLVMRDVILFRREKRIEINDTAKGHFTTQLPVPTPLGTIESTRGWVRADVSIKGNEIRFLNTHLEAFQATIRASQAFELASPAGPLGGSMQKVLVGDLNSDPDFPSPESDAYNAFTDAGYADNGVSVATFGHDASLLNPGAAFTQRIDHVMTKPAMRTRGADLVGEERGNRTPYGLWPSDHGGVVSGLG